MKRQIIWTSKNMRNCKGKQNFVLQMGIFCPVVTRIFCWKMKPLWMIWFKSSKVNLRLVQKSNFLDFVWKYLVNFLMMQINDPKISHIMQVYEAKIGCIKVNFTICRIEFIVVVNMNFSYTRPNRDKCRKFCAPKRSLCKKATLWLVSTKVRRGKLIMRWFFDWKTIKIVLYIMKIENFLFKTASLRSLLQEMERDSVNYANLWQNAKSELDDARKNCQNLEKSRETLLNDLETAKLANSDLKLKWLQTMFQKFPDENRKFLYIGWQTCRKLNSRTKKNSNRKRTCTKCCENSTTIWSWISTRQFTTTNTIFHCKLHTNVLVPRKNCWNKKRRSKKSLNRKKRRMRCWRNITSRWSSILKR